MSLNVNTAAPQEKPRVERPLPTPGSRPARIAQVVDLGIQTRQPFKGKEKAPVHQVFINFELVTDEYEYEGKKVRHRLGPKPLNMVSKKSEFYQNSAIAEFLSGIDPADTAKGDLTLLANRPCLAVITHVDGYGKNAGRKFAAVSKVMEAPEGYPVPQLGSPAVVFTFDAPTEDAWKALPIFIQEKIKSAVNYPGSKVEAMVKSIVVQS